MSVSAAPLTALAILATAPAANARLDPFCDALRQVAAGAAIGFVDVRGPVVAERHTRSLDVYQARVALPEATGCDITVPRGAGRLAPSYVCTFSGGIDVRRAMGRLVRHSARCVRVGVGNPPRLKEGPGGPSFYFPSGVARFDFSASRTPGTPSQWSVAIAISKGPDQPRRPLA